VQRLLSSTIALVAACGVHVTPQQLDDVHRQCQVYIEKGSLDALNPVPENGLGFLREPAPPPVLVYGASWCVVCTVAKSYLARQGIPFVERDIETDPKAAAERAAWLSRAGIAQTRALPVIVARRVVTVGFSPCVVEWAWQKEGPT
jgi:glutaredoxin